MTLEEVMDLNRVPPTLHDLFGATCAHTANDAFAAREPYFRLLGNLLGIWFVPLVDRNRWAATIVANETPNEPGFWARSRSLAGAFASEEFRKSFWAAIESTGAPFCPALISMLSADFLRFARRSEMPKWTAGIHAKAVAHYLGFALSVWSEHPALAASYSLNMMAER